MSSDSPSCPGCGSLVGPDSVDGLCPRCLATEFLGGKGADGSEGSSLQGMSCGDYELIREIGRGGMGVIYEARQQSLNRRVAIKMISQGLLAGAESLLRFRQEAEAAANLKHPHIITIHEVGEFDGQPFFSMDYVQGGHVGDLVRENPLRPREAAVLLLKVANAVSAAHQSGIIHRDIKPSNILIDSSSGEPFVSDFGLAKRINDTSGITMDGVVVGSPHYLSPEQAGESGALPIGPASDIYALGAVLYHLLTGRPPFLGETIQATLSQVQSSLPVELRRLNPKIPKNLETICLKCLHKEPARRYGSARGLAADLGRFLDGKPVTARPLSVSERLTAWCRRNPGMALLGGLAAAFLLSGIGGVLWQWRRADSFANSESRLRSDAEESLRHLHLERADELFLANEAAEGVAHLTSLIRKDPNDRLAATRLLSELTYRRFALPEGDPDPFSGQNNVRFAPVFVDNGKVALTLEFEGREAILSRHPGGESTRITDLPAEVRTGEFALGGRRAAMGCGDGFFCVLDLEPLRIRRQWQLDGEEIFSAQMSDSGEFALARTRSGKMYVWNVDSGVLTARHDIGKSLGVALLSGNGQWIATTLQTSLSRSIRLWKTTASEPLGRPMQCQGEPAYLARSLSDDSLVAGTREGSLEVWSTPEGRRIAILKGDAAIRGIKHGRFNLATASFDQKGIANLWPSPGAGLPPISIVQPREVSKLFLSPDARRLAALSGEQAVFFYNTFPEDFRIATLRLQHAPISVSFANDNSRLVVQSTRDISVYKLDRVPAVGELIATDLALATQAQSGGLVLFGKDRKSVGFVTPGATPSPLQALPIDGSVSAAALSNNGDVLVSAYWDRTVKAFRLRKAESGGVKIDAMSQFTATQRVGSIAVDPLGRYLFTGHRGGIVRRFSLQTGEKVPVGDKGIRRPGSEPRMLVIDAQGKQLAIVCPDQLQVFDAATWTPLSPAFPHRELPNAVRFSADGSRLIVADQQDSIRIRNTAAFSEEPQSISIGGACKALDISPDGSWLAVGSLDRVATIWNLNDLSQRGSAMAHDSEVHAIRFSPDGSCLATGTASGSVRLWDAESGFPLTGRLAQKGGVKGISFRGGDQLVAIGEQARLWWLPVLAHDAPPWLPDLAEAIGGRQLSATGDLIPASMSFAQASEAADYWLQSQADPRDFWSKWGSFILDDSLERPLYPDAATTVRNYRDRHAVISNRISLEEARRVDPHAKDVLRDLIEKVFLERGESDAKKILQVIHHGSLILDQSPDDAETAIYVAAASSRLGHTEPAKRIYDAVNGDSLKGTVPLLCKARVLSAVGEFETAYDAYGAAFTSGIHDARLDGFCREALLERRALGIKNGLKAQAVADFLEDRNIPVRSETTPEKCIDLSANYTASLDEDWHGRHWKGQNLGPLPRQLQALNGVPFDLRGIVQLRGHSLQLSAQGYPEHSAGIEIGKAAKQLHFLHALGWGQFAHAETHVADYVVHYADGSNATVELVNGVDIFEWGGPSSHNTSAEGVSVAWSGTNDRGNGVGLYHKIWVNPRPKTKIESIDFVSTGTNSAPFLVALTVE